MAEEIYNLKKTEEYLRFAEDLMPVCDEFGKEVMFSAGEGIPCVTVFGTVKDNEGRYNAILNGTDVEVAVMSGPSMLAGLKVEEPYSVIVPRSALAQRGYSISASWD